MFGGGIALTARTRAGTRGGTPAVPRRQPSPLRGPPHVGGLGVARRDAESIERRSSIARPAPPAGLASSASHTRRLDPSCRSHRAFASRPNPCTGAGADSPQRSRRIFAEHRSGARGHLSRRARPRAVASCLHRRRGSPLLPPCPLAYGPRCTCPRRSVSPVFSMLILIERGLRARPAESAPQRRDNSSPARPGTRWASRWSRCAVRALD